MKLLLLILSALVGLLVVLEVSLRFLGFGNPLTYLADEEIGYLLAPNQSTRRLGNRIAINEYSMRTQSITAKRPQSTLRVLLLGDSIANGGWWTDQDQTISALLATYLESSLKRESQPNSTSKAASETVEVLNASANSWGPRNELAYLKRFGTFEAQALVLLINTDDLFAKKPSSAVVGRDRNYPLRQPPLAMLEIFSRLFSREVPPAIAAEDEEPGGVVGINLEAIRQIKVLVEASGAKFVLAMTPLLREIGSPGPRDYEIKERARLMKFTKDLQITYLDFLPVFNSTEAPANLYHDHIHLNLQGNQKVTEVIGQALQALLSHNSALESPPVLKEG
ncbi:MAG: SGNH/GDSL hydrolase family protein [Symploca sp. SIO3C6]|nr:SGNH/GDSL hydrolase family protein [Symploca sp. SIO3C6]